MKTAKESCLKIFFVLLFSSLVFGCGSSSNDDSNDSQPKNRPPVAKIESFDSSQTDISAFVNQPFTFNATGSSDPDSDALSFLWEITKPSGSNVSFIDNSVSTVTFKPDVAGDYSVKLTVSDASASDVITLTFKVAANTPPQADAGSDQVANLNDTITLSSANSTDADGHTLSTFAWAFKAKPTGSNATITGVDSASASFTVDTDGAYEIELTVTDEFGESDTDTVTVSTQNIAPVACTSANIVDKKVSETAMLDGSCSSDINGDNLTYTWVFKTKPDGSNPALDDATAVKPSFQIDKKGEYVVSLVVNDGNLDSPPAEQKVNAINSAPVANAGADQALDWGDTVTLTGAGSSDIDGDNINFTWSFLSTPEGSTASLNDASAISPQFVVDRDGDYQVQLIVSDGELSSSPDTVLVTGSNVKPVANFGDDRSVELGQEICFDASSSSDANGDSLTYKWSVTTKPDTSTANLSASDIETPCITPDIEGVYIIQLIVNDGLVDSDAVTVNVSSSQKQLAPLAKAGSDIDNVLGLKIELDGSGSNDPNGEDITYSWSVLNKPGSATATLSNATISQPELAVNLPGDYLVQLIVNDGIENSAPDQVLVKVVDGDPDNDGLLSSDELKIGLDPTAETTAGSTVKDGDRDHDNDNVPNKWERELGYDIGKDDTDSNGTLDGDEDFDKDGLSNAQEIANGTDPKDPKDPGVIADFFSFELKNSVITPGGEITYLVTVSNPDRAKARRNAQVSFVIPEYINFSDNDDATPPATSKEGKIVRWKLGDIEPGQSKNIYIKASVSYDAIPDRRLSTSAIVTFDGVSGTTITPIANIVTKEEKPLSFEFTADNDAIIPGGSYTYTLNVGNPSNKTIKGTKVRAILPKGVTAIDLDGGTQTGQMIDWFIGDIKEGESLHKELVVKIDKTFKAGKILNAKAMLTHVGGLAIDQKAVSSVSVHHPKLMVVGYKLLESKAIAGGKLNYIISVAKSPHKTKFKVKVRIPGKYMKFSERNRNLTSWNENTATLDIDLESNQSKSLKFYVRVAKDVPAGQILQSDIFVTVEGVNDSVHFEETVPVVPIPVFK